MNRTAITGLQLDHKAVIDLPRQAGLVAAVCESITTACGRRGDSLDEDRTRALGWRKLALRSMLRIRQTVLLLHLPLQQDRGETR